ncbi:MAG TPA: aldehyde ferredoxin oxidoreductase C-terminal domain-containing protein, partial [Dehalococcoidia bacterium]|nr:aldehyde ferredoxin oxidoreductase C-terminal domain-containing protein [Dehalococcoidia bacterium]
MEGARERAVTRFVMDATPGRHTQEAFGRHSFAHHLVNASGLCSFGYLGMLGMDVPKYLTGFLAAVTGWERSWEELEKAAERIMAMRQAFNSREGINPVQYRVHPRILGNPPQTTGPLSGITVDPTDEIRKDLRELDWDAATAKPNKAKLLELGLDDVAKDLWP